MEENNLSELAAMMDDHQVTGEDGQPLKEEAETPEEPAPQTQEPQPDETPQEEKKEAEVQDEETSPDLVEDESGKKYVPEERFKQVYGKMKSFEREIERTKTEPKKEPNPFDALKEPVIPGSKADQLEAELLYATMPEFNPDSDKYSKELDVLGATIWKANPGMTKVEAARQAKSYAKQLLQKQDVIKSENKTVKVMQSDSGIASKSTTREPVSLDPDKMTLEEKEAYLKSQGLW